MSSVNLVTKAVAVVEPSAAALLVTRAEVRLATALSAFCDVGQSDFWFPVAPGTTTLPEPPAATTNATPLPPNAVPVPPDFDPDDLCYLFQDLLPVGQPPVYPVELEPNGILLPYNETLPLVGRTRVRLAIREFNYALTLPGEAVALVTRTVISIPTYIASFGAGAFTFTGQTAGTYRNRKLAGGVGAFAATGFSSGFVRNLLIGTNAGTFTLSGQAGALLYSRLPLAAEAGSFVVDGQDADRFVGKTLGADAGAFTLSGQTSGSVRGYVMAGAAGSFNFTGQAAGLTYIQPAFKAVTYTGNGTTTNAVTGVGFTPGIVWTKRTTTTATHHQIVATAWNVSTPTYYSASTSNTSNTSSSSELMTFDSDGFTIKSSTLNNTSSASYIAWCWKAGGAVADDTNGSITSQVSYNSDMYMSNFTYQGAGGTTTVGHGIAAGAPDIVFIKNMSATNAGQVGFTAINPNSLSSNSTAAKGALSIFNGFNATTLGLANSAFVNTNGSRYVGFAFKSKAGVSKIDVFAGNGSSTQAITGLGFTPSFVMVKSYLGGTSDWVIFTSGRDGRLFANTSAVESATDYITFDSDGFTLESGASVNSSGVDYIYMAFA